MSLEINIRNDLKLNHKRWEMDFYCDFLYEKNNENEIAMQRQMRLLRWIYRFEWLLSHVVSNIGNILLLYECDRCIWYIMW